MTNQNPSANLLTNLNDRQKEAVSTTDGPLLILAGAGSGKTKVVAHRIANLIQNGANPESILAITFTNKAAAEMKKRVLHLIGEEVNSSYTRRNEKIPFVSTFHALGVYFLREEGRAAGFDGNFSIMDEEDALSLLKECLKELALDPKQYQPAKIRSLISRYKNEFLEPQDVAEEAADSPFMRNVLNIWDKYATALKEHKGADFDDLIVLPVKILKNNPEILAKYQDKWRYIHVDEYQDTNRPQYLLIKLLASKHQNICCVGDIDQSIYGWRGADFRNIMDFEKDYSKTKIVTLEENYRSTQNILEAANAIIIKNLVRKPKNLFTSKSAGAKIKLFSAANELEEARFIAGNAFLAIRNGTPPEQIAVLYRTNFQSRVIEEAFLKLNLPYQLIGVKFYERREVKDILSYLRAALNDKDLLSIKRAINTPPRGIGKVLLTKFLAGDELRGKETEKIKSFQEALAKIEGAVRSKKASEAMHEALRFSGYQTYLNDGTEEGKMRLGNIAELVSLAKRYDEYEAPAGLEKLLSDAALMSDQDTLKTEQRAVRLMTVHAAKGLEFNTVFVSGMEDGLFPHNTFSGDDEMRQEEERRLFYVAVTRAEKELHLSHAFFRTIFGSKQVSRPSRFIADIPEELLESLDYDNALPQDHDFHNNSNHFNQLDRAANDDFPSISL
jgi:DNA helicase-2/ATP-dependent DNA helicase PcrA